MDLIITAAQSASIPGDISRNITRHVRVAAMAAEHGAQLLVFPELSLIGYELSLSRANVIRPDAAELGPLRQAAMKARMTISAGGPWLNAEGQLHITAFVFRPDGSISIHTKQHVHQSEQHVFTSGPGGPTLRVADSSVALAICADASQPSHAANAAARGANVYAVGAMITEDAYARKTTLLKNYALEHHMAVLLANYSGVTGGEESAGKSAIWSEDGQPVAASAGTDEALVMGTKQNGQWTGEVIPLSLS